VLIIRVAGGLGNQMFQYALYRSLINKGRDAYIDLNWFRKNNIHNGYELKRVFNIIVNKSTDKMVELLDGDDFSIIGKMKKKLHLTTDKIYYAEGEKALIYIPEIFSFENKYLSGYWQSEKYFWDLKNDIKKDFTFPAINDFNNMKLMEEMRKVNSVSVHVRRGDYQSEKLFKNICNADYYKRALYLIDRIVKDAKIYVFSNDIKWCKDVFSDYNVNYVENNVKNNSYIDMHLMSLCKHHIVANSTFSWWGAWLGEYENTYVIAPQRWHNGKMSEDIIPKRWIRI